MQSKTENFFSIETSNLLRLLAISSVLIIHATAGAEKIFHKTHALFSFDFLAVLLNQAARFCVPIFILLSGYGLTLKYKKNQKIPLRDFIKSRTSKIILPFIFISALFMLLLSKFYFPANSSILNTLKINSLLWGESLLTGSADYHLYFLSIIIQCYILFPLLFKLKSKVLWWSMLFIQILLTSPSHVFLHKIGIQLPNFPSSLCLYWIFYFYTGILLAKNILFQKTIKSDKKLLGWYLLCGIFALVMIDYILRSWTNPTPDYYNHFNRQSVIFFTLAVSIFFATHNLQIKQWLIKNNTRKKILAKLSALSFSIYLLHTLLLRQLDKLLPQNFSLIKTILLFSFSVLGVLLLDFIIRKPLLLRSLIGLPAKKQTTQQIRSNKIKLLLFTLLNNYI